MTSITLIVILDCKIIVKLIVILVSCYGSFMVHIFTDALRAFVNKS